MTTLTHKKKERKTLDKLTHVNLNKFQAIIIVCLLILVAFLIGKSQSLTLTTQVERTPTPTPTISPTPTLTPTPTPTQVYYQTIVTPTPKVNQAIIDRINAIDQQTKEIVNSMQNTKNAIDKLPHPCTNSICATAASIYMSTINNLYNQEKQLEAEKAQLQIQLGQ